MTLNAGTYRITADTGKISVYTYKEGVLSAIAHDLLIEVTNFTVNLHVSTDAIPSSMSVEAQIKADSLRVACAMKDGQCQYDILKEKDKADIEEATFKDVLHVAKYPAINFRSHDIKQTSEGDYHVKGELTLHGVTRPIEFDVKTVVGDALQGKVTISQKDYGIKPYKAFLGTLKVKNEVDVVFNLSKLNTRA
ncbi:MAG: YceI family protein [Candidatus Brocadia sp.]|nr:YceI family protein [Candidatus Brocadia sp.]